MQWLLSKITFPPRQAMCTMNQSILNEMSMELSLHGDMDILNSIKHISLLPYRVYYGSKQDLYYSSAS